VARKRPIQFVTLLVISVLYFEGFLRAVNVQIL